MTWSSARRSFGRCGAASSTRDGGANASKEAAQESVEARVAAALGTPPPVALLDLPGRSLERGGCSRLIAVATDGRVTATATIDLPGGGEPLPAARPLGRDGGGAGRVELHIGAGGFAGDRGVHVLAVDAQRRMQEQRVASVAEVIATVRAAFELHPPTQRSITVCPRTGTEFHEVASVLAPLVAEFAGESISFAGVPFDFGAGEQIDAALQPMALPPIDENGDLLVAVDACAPWGQLRPGDAMARRARARSHCAAGAS